MQKQYKVDKKLKKYVRELVRKAAYNIGVTNYELDIYYNKDPKEDGPKVAGSMDTDRRYLTGILNLYPPVMRAWKDKDFETIKTIIHHEVAHLATQHLFDIATAVYKDEGETRDAWETLTTVVGRLSELCERRKEDAQAM